MYLLVQWYRFPGWLEGCLSFGLGKACWNHSHRFLSRPLPSIPYHQTYQLIYPNLVASIPMTDLDYQNQSQIERKNNSDVPCSESGLKLLTIFVFGCVLSCSSYHERCVRRLLIPIWNIRSIAILYKIRKHPKSASRKQPWQWHTKHQLTPSACLLLFAV